jgi:L-amino acid N-acyltransferase YncA
MHQVGFKNDRWIDVDLLQLDLHARNLPSRRVEG